MKKVKKNKFTIFYIYKNIKLTYFNIFQYILDSYLTQAQQKQNMKSSLIIKSDYSPKEPYLEESKINNFYKFN